MLEGNFVSAFIMQVNSFTGVFVLQISFHWIFSPSVHNIRIDQFKMIDLITNDLITIAYELKTMQKTVQGLSCFHYRK